MDFSEMHHVSWEHEYFTDDDAAAFDTREEAEAFAAKLAEKGKRRIRISSPGDIEDVEDEDA